MARNLVLKSLNHKRYMREVWYPKNKKKHMSFVQKNKRELREWIASLKFGKSCARCPEDHPACLDYHHRDPARKLMSIARVASAGWSKKKIMAEIAKCDLICSNCHRKEHYSRS